MSDESTNHTGAPSKEDIFEELKGVEDPELRMSIVELGLVLMSMPIQMEL